MPDITNPHDAFFKRMFSEQEAVQDFLRYYLSEQVTQHFDLNSLRLVKDSFVDEELQEHFSDLLYEVKLTSGSHAYVAMLFEHKSYVDKEVAFQLLRYLVRIWEYGRRQRPPFHPILPIVVYHGMRQWDVSEEFQALFEMPEELKTYVPSYQYYRFSIKELPF